MSCDGANVANVLEIERLAVRRGDGFAVAVPRLSLDGGSVAALHGPSGCGKSTLLRACFGLHHDDENVSGAVRLDGEEVRGRKGEARRRLLRSDIAFLMQDAHAALDPLWPIGLQVQNATGAKSRAIVAVLQRLQVKRAAELCERLPHEVSGGQAQCALLAIAFLRAPSLVVADEPSASLDRDNYDQHVAHFRELAAAGSALLVATHDHRLLQDLRADVLSLQSGAFVPGLPLAPAWPKRQSGVDVGTAPVLSAKGITVTNGAQTVLRSVDLVVRRGEVVAIVGASGAGKTTLGRVLAGHRRPNAGTVSVPPRRGAVQLVCQDAYGSLTPGRTIRSLVDEARSPFVDVEAVARELRLQDAVLDRTADSLSGGERRRAALLRAIAVHPDVLVLDEPTAGLDRASALAAMDLLLAMQRQRGLAIVLITHDAELATAIADRVVTVSGGRLCES